MRRPRFVGCYLNDLIEHASYIGASGNQLRWKPNTKKLNDVIDAARGLVKLPDGAGAATWLDGRDELVIPCANGLLKLADRTLLPHTPTTLTSWCCRTSTTRRQRHRGGCGSWMKCSASIRKALHCLGNGFGHVLSGRTDL